MAKLPFALQLYTVRDHLDRDPAGTLERVKAAGYDYVELAGTGGLPHEAFKVLLDQNGLRPVSCHTGLDELVKDVGPSIEAARVYGVRYFVFSWNASDRAGWAEAGRKANAAGAKLREAGLQLCYHNHAQEFTRYDGEYALDILLGEAEPVNLAAEIDVYWAKFGGVDPVELIDRMGRRAPLLHIKDMTASEPHTFTEVGRGIIDMPAVFRAGARAGAEWYIVEQDTCAGDSLDSARVSAEYMARQTL